MSQTTIRLIAVLALLALLVGCNSDDPNPLGANLQETKIDTVLAPVYLDEVIQLGMLDVTNTEVPFDEVETLYLGSQSLEASSILANYDFGIFAHPDSVATDTLLTVDNVTSVEITLIMLDWYSKDRGVDIPDDGSYDNPVKPWPGAQKYYDVHQLTAPFDTLSYPGAEPDHEPGVLNTTNELQPNSGKITINITKERVVQWIEERAKVGIVIREGIGSEPGLLGFASKEMVHGGSTLPVLDAETALGPGLNINMSTVPDHWPAGYQSVVMWPSADVSTFHEIEETSADPTDAVMLRTHLRSYPAIRFDISSLPPGIRINSANLVVVNDTSRSYGHRTVLTCSELPVDFAPDGEHTAVTLDDIETEIYFLSGVPGFTPESVYEHVIKFDVASSIQRGINGAYEGDRSFLLAAGEYFFPGYNSNPDPDFWFTKWVFHGMDAPITQRPRLEITYTRNNAISGSGGE